MPKYTVQNGSVITLVGGNRVTLQVGAELELTKAQAEKMDREGHYLCLSSEFGKVKKAAPPKPAPVEDDEEQDEDDELERLTKPSGK